MEKLLVENSPIPRLLAPCRQQAISGTTSQWLFSVARNSRCASRCPEREGAALKLQPLGGTAVAQDGLAPSGSRAGQRCADALPKLLWNAHWRLGAGLADLGPKEG